MGRYDFRPSRVYQAATRLIETGRVQQTPPWYKSVGEIPPSQTLVRTQPIQHHEPSKRARRRKASKCFKPQRITYEEDALRRQFYRDHPWELARPRTVLETDGKDHQSQDWSSIKQDARMIDGESVVQRQLWLQANSPRMTKEGAYDQARKEFYAERLQQEVEMRVAKEEALATSAYFGKSRVQIGGELEDHSYEAWRRKANDAFVAMEQKRASSISSAASTEGETPADEPEATQEGIDTLNEETENKQGR